MSGGMRIPGEKEALSTRCRISHRPPFRTAEPVFYRCGECGNVIVMNRREGGAGESETTVSCCGTELPALIPEDAGDAREEHRMRYTVFGGFEHTSTNVSVDNGAHPMNAEHRIEWIYMRTYQGGQLKMLPFPGKSSASFSFAEEDAYVYCDRDICKMGREHCQFQCRRGMMAYAYCNVHGLFSIKLGEKEVLDS